MVYAAHDSNLEECLRKLDSLVIQLGRYGTEEEKQSLITTCWAYWDSKTPKQKTPKQQPQVFFPILKSLLPYLNKEARAILIEKVLSEGIIVKSFGDVMYEFVGHDFRKRSLEQSEDVIHATADFLSEVNSNDLNIVSLHCLEIFNEVALYLVNDFNPRTLEDLSRIIAYLDVATKEEIIVRLKSKFIAADSTTKASMEEALTNFLVDNLKYFTQRTVRKLQEWAMRLISGTDHVNRAFGRAFIKATITQLNKEEQRNARFMLKLFT